jgi:ribosome-associated heat shock protein Hsp15
LNEDKLTLRVDKWLWQARFFKTRSLATKLVKSGKLRLNSVLISKPSRGVEVEDILTFPKEMEIRVIKICDLGQRRGPASEAQRLYQDLVPVESKPRLDMAPRGESRPTAKERKALVKFKHGLEQS